jgi:hypothetical protein
MEEEILEDNAVEVRYEAEPTQGTAIDVVHNGMLWVKTRPMSFWAKALFGVSAVGACAAIFFIANDAPDKELAGKKFDNSLYMSQTSPELLAGITPDTPPLEIIQKLQTGIGEYDKLLGQETSSIWQAAYINEAHNIITKAAVEAESGKYNTVSPFPAIDLTKCPDLLGSVNRCIYFRTELWGINAFWAGVKANDLSAMLKGYAQYKAASIAFNPPGKIAIDSDRLVSGLIKQTRANYVVQQAIAPGSTNPALELRTVPGSIPIPESDRNTLGQP